MRLKYYLELKLQMLHTLTHSLFRSFIRLHTVWVNVSAEYFLSPFACVRVLESLKMIRNIKRICLCEHCNIRIRIRNKQPELQEWREKQKKKKMKMSSKLNFYTDIIYQIKMIIMC